MGTVIDPIIDNYHKKAEKRQQNIPISKVPTDSESEVHAQTLIWLISPHRPACMIIRPCRLYSEQTCARGR